MGWLDDARKKAEEKADEAKSKAQEKAAEAAVAAAGAAMKKSVGGFFDGLLSSAEASLAEAEDRARARGLKLDGPDLDGPEELEQQIREPEPDPLGEAVRRAEAVAWEAPEQVSEPVQPAVERVETPVEPLAADPTPAVQLPDPPPPRDPFADAFAAIAKAREARGLGPEEEEPVVARPSDPVEAALAAAREAREMASGSRREREREAAARETLAALKAARGAASPSGSEEEEGDPPPKPKKRTL